MSKFRIYLLEVDERHFLIKVNIFRHFFKVENMKSVARPKNLTRHFIVSIEAEVAIKINYPFRFSRG